MKRIIGFTFLMLFACISYSQETIKSGTWTEKSYEVKGKWSIVKADDQYKIVLNDYFKTKNAPDLKIFLSKKSKGDLKSSNATKEAVFVSKLKSAKGGQEYVIPADVNIEDYQSIIIHCEEYSVLWSAASLK